MSDEPVDGPAPAEVPCRHCRLPIPNDAVFCTHCRHFQNWRRYLEFSNTSLALLVALITIAGVVVPQLYELWDSDDSRVTLSQPTADGTVLRMVASNSGEVPGTINSVRMNSPAIHVPIHLRFRNPEDAFIAPGSQPLILDFVPLLSAEQARRSEAEARALGNAPENQASIRAYIMQSSGKLDFQGFTLDPVFVASLLGAHADRCDEVDRPTAQNGCLGIGDGDASVVPAGR